MSKALDFYKLQCTDHENRTLKDYMLFNDNDMEAIHDYIQWMFPNKEYSKYNPYAPILTQSDINAFHNDVILQERILTSLQKFKDFLFNTQNNWNKPHNHNLLRITRVLYTLRDLISEKEAEDFYLWVIKIHNPNAQTDIYWRNALKF